MLNKDYQAKLQEEAYGDADKVIEEQLDIEYELDLNNLPKQKHNWVKRGDILSCENAGHSNHRHFLVKRANIDSTTNS